MAALKHDALADLNAEGARLTEQLRRQAALAAIDQAMTELPNRLDNKAQGLLIDSSIQNLGNS
jgi:F-type H+-transporting ATPase subunit b